MINNKQSTSPGLSHVRDKIRYGWSELLKKLKEPFEVISGKGLLDTPASDDTLTELESKIGEQDN